MKLCQPGNSSVFFPGVQSSDKNGPLDPWLRGAQRPLDPRSQGSVATPRQHVGGSDPGLRACVWVCAKNNFTSDWLMCTLTTL